MTEKTLTTENIKPALDALRGELAPWPVVAKKQDRLNTAQLNAANSGITSSLVAQIIANTAAIRALESAITGTGLRALVVATLPAVGTTGILYIVPVTTYDPDTDADVVNYSNEYIWIPVEAGQASEGHYEQVGQTGIVINNGQLTITVNGTSVGTFTANQSGDTTAAITVPTNADYVDRTTDQTVAGVKTFSSTINGTASKAIADEDGTSIKTGYVNIAGNQTVTGDKSFTGSNTFNSILPNATNTYSLGSSSYQWSSVYAQSYYYNGTQWGLDKYNVWTNRNIYENSALTIRNNSIQDTTAPSTDTGIALLEVWSEANQYWGGFGYKWLANGNSELIISLSNWNGNAQGYWEYKIGANKAFNDLYFAPPHNLVNLGTSTNQWKSVYSQTYYYNGTAWGLDKANEWTGNNEYKYLIGLSGGEIWFKQPNIEDITTNPNTDTSKSILQIWNKGTTQYFGGIIDSLLTDGTHRFTISCFGFPLNSYGGYYPHSFSFEAKRDGTASFSPSYTNASLGTSANKWKTLNGVNPGALSLPSSSYIDISGDITIRDGSAANSLTASCDGWIAINSFATWLQISDDTTLMATTVTPGADGFAQTFLPVRQGDSIRIAINQTGTNFQSFRLIPCLGNV